MEMSFSIGETAVFLYSTAFGVSARKDFIWWEIIRRKLKVPCARNRCAVFWLVLSVRGSTFLSETCHTGSMPLFGCGCAQFATRLR